MSQLETIAAQIRSLPRRDAEELQDWLSEYLEDQAELNPEFVKSIERGNADLQAGRVRIEKP
jgi:mRNA-degrading endonuclease RelE of RelBE toxin-antitoxin system